MHILSHEAICHSPLGMCLRPPPVLRKIFNRPLAKEFDRMDMMGFQNFLCTILLLRCGSVHVENMLSLPRCLLIQQIILSRRFVLVVGNVS